MSRTFSPDERILLAHGGGGARMHALIRDVFLHAFDNPVLAAGGDSAVLPPDVPHGARLAVTTDAYVVQPLEFPGGCIGDLAVHGTINDLAMVGARPLALTAAFILEEGLPLETLARIAARMGTAARSAGVPVVTGDTKVVERGACDAMYVITTGIGTVAEDIALHPSYMRDGDAVLVSGPVGAHGIAVLSRRQGLAFDTDVISDTRPLHRAVAALLAAVPGVRVLRDPTRGGLSATLNELVAGLPAGIEIDEEALPVSDPVQGACDLLGLDPLVLANEGVFCAIVAAEAADAALHTLRGMEETRGAVAIGRVTADLPGLVRARTAVGGTRIIPMPGGELLPRIC